MDYPVFWPAAHVKSHVKHMMTLFRYFKSELPYKSQVNEYLTVQDIESANKKVKFVSQSRVEIICVKIVHKVGNTMLYFSTSRVIYPIPAMVTRQKRHIPAEI